MLKLYATLAVHIDSLSILQTMHCQQCRCSNSAKLCLETPVEVQDNILIGMRKRKIKHVSSITEAANNLC